MHKSQSWIVYNSFCCNASFPITILVLNYSIAVIGWYVELIFLHLFKTKEFTNTWAQQFLNIKRSLASSIRLWSCLLNVNITSFFLSLSLSHLCFPSLLYPSLSLPYLSLCILSLLSFSLFVYLIFAFFLSLALSFSLSSFHSLFVSPISVCLTISLSRSELWDYFSPVWSSNLFLRTLDIVFEAST